jgi:hypothetical protein
MASVTGTTTNPEEAGVKGESKLYDGVRGISHAPQHGGVVGINDDTGDNAGPGVFGASKGTGIWGESKTWMGVYGKTDSTVGGAGVMGESDSAAGVIGKSAIWVGVYGETAGLDNGPAGVWGEHKGGGIGVKAVSKDGVGLVAFSANDIGVHATGKRLAGFFDGEVNITGNLTIQGVSIQIWLQRIIQLEQQVASLSQQVIALNQRVLQISPTPPSGGAGTPAGGGVGSTAFINATLQFSNGSNLTLDVSGNGFKAGEQVSIDIASRLDNANPVTHSATVNADGMGFVNYRESVICQAGHQTVFSVKAKGQSSGRQSNTSGASC